MSTFLNKCAATTELTHPEPCLDDQAVPQSYILFHRSLFCLPAIISVNIFTLAEILMENKRDASTAGLPWPLPPSRDAPPSSGTSSTSLTPNNTTLPSTTSEMPSSPPPTTTKNPPTSPTPYIPPNPIETPFPLAEPLHYDFHARPRHFERIVHQIHFKIYTRANNETSLYIEEIPISGIPRSRDPEYFFYGLSSNWNWSCHTADYWRHFFNVPLVHGHHPYTQVEIARPDTLSQTPPTTDLAAQARQLEDSWRMALASGELPEASRMLNNMSFIDALRALGQRVEITRPPSTETTPSLSTLATQARQLQEAVSEARASGVLHEASRALDQMPFIDALGALRLLDDGSASDL